MRYCVSDPRYYDLSSQKSNGIKKKYSALQIHIYIIDCNGSEKNLLQHVNNACF